MSSYTYFLHVERQIHIDYPKAVITVNDVNRDQHIWYFSSIYWVAKYIALPTEGVE